MDFTAERKVRLEGVENLKLIEERYPQYAALDKVLFTLGHEYRELNEIDQALQAFKRLSERSIKSSYQVGAYIEIGDIFLAKKDYDFAIQQYEKALSGDEQEKADLARYKISLVYLQKGEFSRAFDLLMEVVQKNQVRNPELKDEALVASVWPFTEATPEDLRKRPEMHSPVSFYRRLSSDKNSYRRVLAKLARRFELKKRDADAMKVWTELMRVSDDVNERSEALESFYVISKKLKTEFYDRETINEVVKSLWMIRSEETNDVIVKKTYKKYEPLLRDLVTTNQQAALKTNRVEDFDLVIAGHKDYLWLFPESNFAADMKVNLAEAYYHSGKKVSAGLTYFDVTEKSPKYGRTKELFDSALQSFSEAFKENDKLSLLEKFQGRRGFRDLARAFTRKFPRDPSLPVVKFNYARSLYDEQRFDVAVKALRGFVFKFPRDKNAEAAAMLLLDCYFVRDDLKGMIAEGNLLARKSPLSADLKSKISQTIQQTQLKNVRSVAGDFNSKEYAEQFLEFAKQNKGSALGEQATLEAFASLRSANDLRMFEVGEQYISQFQESPKAKDVLNLMIQQALLWFDFRNAAKYLFAFGVKFKDDPNARSFLEQSARIYELLGIPQRAALAYQKIGEPSKSAQILFAYGKFDQTISIAKTVPGIEGTYYHGLSMVQLGKVSEGIVLLDRLGPSAATTQEQKAMIAHALMIGLKNSVETYSKLGMGQEFSPALIQAKNLAYQELDKKIQLIIAQQEGRWTVAALRVSSYINKKFADFLRSLQSPKAIKQEVFQKMMSGQIAQYEKASKDMLDQCSQVSEANEIFSQTFSLCKTGNLNLSQDSYFDTPLKEGSQKDGPYGDVRKRIAQSSRDTKLMKELADLAVKSQDYGFAALVYQRLQEIDPANIQVKAHLGTMELFRGRQDFAVSLWNSVLKQDGSNSTALTGIAGVMRQFGFIQQAQKMKGKLVGKIPPQPLHPWMK
jgi:tetratricopeptide (TPR) repeat protein